MDKWADYAIVGVKFRDEKRHILEVKVRDDTGEKLSNERRIKREKVVELIESGKTFVTATLKNNKWKNGEDVGIVTIGNIKFIRTDRNNTAEDNLGKLPEYE